MPAARVLLGVVGRPHGVRGLLHVQSFAANPTDLSRYALEDEGGRRFLLRWQGEGIAELFELVGGRRIPVADRTAAARLTNTRLHVARDDLPAPGWEEFYLADLIGLEAATPDGEALGRVEAVHDYGAGASLEIGRRLVPFTRVCVPEIDLPSGRLTVVPPEERDAP